jgi:hypothetical protein
MFKVRYMHVWKSKNEISYFIQLIYTDKNVVYIHNGVFYSTTKNEFILFSGK